VFHLGGRQVAIQVTCNVELDLRRCYGITEHLAEQGLDPVCGLEVAALGDLVQDLSDVGWLDLVDGSFSKRGNVELQSAPVAHSMGFGNLHGVFLVEPLPGNRAEGVFVVFFSLIRLELAGSAGVGSLGK